MKITYDLRDLLRDHAMDAHTRDDTVPWGFGLHKITDGRGWAECVCGWSWRG